MQNNLIPDATARRHFERGSASSFPASEESYWTQTRCFASLSMTFSVSRSTCREPFVPVRRIAGSRRLTQATQVLLLCPNGRS